MILTNNSTVRQRFLTFDGQYVTVESPPFFSFTNLTERAINNYREFGGFSAPNRCSLFRGELVTLYGTMRVVRKKVNPFRRSLETIHHQPDDSCFSRKRSAPERRAGERDASVLTPRTRRPADRRTTCRTFRQTKPHLNSGEGVPVYGKSARSTRDRCSRSPPDMALALSIFETSFFNGPPSG